MKSQRGFTLIELLVVMSLLSLVMLGFNSALRTMAQTENRVDARLQRADQMRLVRQFLEPLLQRVDATKYNALSAQGGKAILFRADGQAIQWVGVMPARPGLGGRGHLQLTLEADPADALQQQLVVRFLPWQTPGAAMPWAAAQTHVLVRGLRGWRVETEGLPATATPANVNFPRGWQPRWSNDQELPQRLRLTLQDALGEWPPILMPVFPSVVSMPGSGLFSIGGRGN